jgi:hydrogenase maturation protein HypF
MACAWLVAAGCDVEPLGGVDPRAWEAVAGLARSGTASPQTTSVGRLFDAVAALCGLRLTVNYEGQAAVELEAACDPLERGSYPLPLLDRGGRIVLDARETFAAALMDVRSGAGPGMVGARFHNALATATEGACMQLVDRAGLETVVLSGGSFQNRRLLESVAANLQHTGLRVLVPERLPPNDGGISYGQAAVAAARLASGVEERS